MKYLDENRPDWGDYFKKSLPYHLEVGYYDDEGVYHLNEDHDYSGDADLGKDFFNYHDNQDDDGNYDNQESKVTK